MDAWVQEMIGKHHYYRVGAQEAAEMVAEHCPEGWRATADTNSGGDVRLRDLESKGFAFCVGDVKPNSFNYPLYVYNIEAMKQHHQEFDVKYGTGSKAMLVPKGQPGPPKQFPNRLEFRYDDATKTALDMLKEQSGEDASAVIRRIIQNASQ